MSWVPPYTMLKGNGTFYNIQTNFLIKLHIFLSEHSVSFFPFLKKTILVADFRHRLRWGGGVGVFYAFSKLIRTE